MTDAQSSAAYRTLGAALVLLLHLALVAALISAITNTPTIAPVAHEIILRFLPRPLPPAPKKPEAAPERRPHGHPLTALPDYRGITFPPTPQAPSLGGVGRALFGCSPENLANLPPDERTRCAAAMAIGPSNSVDFRDHVNRSADAAHWERGRARKNSPLLLPCMNPQQASVSLGTLLCLGKGAVDGFDLDNQPGYGDAPEVTHVPNNGDPPDGLR